jgi:hypothetical protein
MLHHIAKALGEDYLDISIEVSCAYLLSFEASRSDWQGGFQAELTAELTNSTGGEIFCEVFKLYNINVNNVNLDVYYMFILVM